MLEVVVGRGMHGHRLDAELAAGAQDPERDLAPIGDYDFVEHGLRGYSMTNSGWPNSTGSPFVAMIAVTLPDLSLSIWFIIFIASMMQRTWPSLTSLPISTKGFAPGVADA